MQFCIASNFGSAIQRIAGICLFLESKGVFMEFRDSLLHKVSPMMGLQFIAFPFLAAVMVFLTTADCQSAYSQEIAGNRPATVCDSGGNIWAVWHDGPAGSRDIYIGRLPAGAGTFEVGVCLTTNVADQCNPSIAMGGDNRLYVVWQDNRRGNWDIYGATSLNGISWSAEQQIADSDNDHNYNQINPALAVDSRSPSRAYVGWQDDRAGNMDIYIAESSDAFATNVCMQVTSNTSAQTDPAIAVDSSGTVHLLWTDARNTANGTDIYGASASPWTNVPVISKAADQFSPQIVVESSGSVLHMLWVDRTWGDADICYASSADLPAGPLAGINLVDDTLNAEQLSPTLAVTGAGDAAQVFACWQDERNISAGGGDVDLYMVQVNSGSGTNVFVGDGGANSDQTEPAIGIDHYGYPYIIWADNRDVSTGIYYAGSAYAEPITLVAREITVASGGTIGAGDIADVDDVSIAIPPGACPYDVTISITRIVNPHDCSMPCLNGFEFGPSGLEFSSPVTITIPYVVSSTAGTPLACWYDSNAGIASQDGIDNVEIIEINPNLHALRFTTTHLTPYYALLEPAPDTGDDDTVDDGKKPKPDKSQKGRDNNNGGRKDKKVNIASGQMNGIFHAPSRPS